MKFNVKYYNNEKMVLIKYKEYEGKVWEESFDLDDCKITNNKKQLICKLSKKDIDRYIIEPHSNYYLISIVKDRNYLPLYHLDVDIITINYNITEKKDIYVDLTKLLKNRILLAEGIAVETNVTEISDLYTTKFRLPTNEFSFDCRFKKYEEAPLFLTCESSYKIGKYPFGVIKEKIFLKDINPRFNFIILPKIISEKIETINKKGVDLRYFYPHTLDFVSQNSIQIYFVGGYEYIQNARGFSFGTINDTLSCYSDFNFKICTVYKRYFKGKKNGEYSIYQINSLNEKEKIYEIFPAKVILTSEKSDKNDENNENDANNLYSHYQVLKRLIPLILMFAF